MQTLRDLVGLPASPSVEAVLIGYGQKEAFEAIVLSRKGEVTGHSVYLIGLEVQARGGDKLLLEVPELKDPSDTQKLAFNCIQVFRDIKPGTNVALVVYKDSLSAYAGFNGSIRALVPLPISEHTSNTIAYSAELNLDSYMRGIFPAENSRSLDC